MSKFIELSELNKNHTFFFRKDKIEFVSCIYNSPKNTRAKVDLSEDLHNDNHLWNVCIETESMEDYKIYCSTYLDCLVYIQKLIMRLES